MNRFRILFVYFFLSAGLTATANDSTNIYRLPDSVKAVNFISTVQLTSMNASKKLAAGIRTDRVSLTLESGKKLQSIVFSIPKSSVVMTTGLDVKSRKGRIEWAYPWTSGDDYKLLISSAADSAGNFVIYSGYIFLPKENKWKLIGTCKINGTWSTMTGLESFLSYKGNGTKSKHSDTWVQRNNGSWYNLNRDASATPVIVPLSSIDSIRQTAADQQIIAKSVNEGLKDVPNAKEGIYYGIIKEGTGRMISVNDTVTAFYKGYLLKDGTIFDQTSKDPRTFPLNRLIKGWQVGLTGTKVGGKIKLLIPSVYGYGIRTRAAKIPPNSILIFEIEVLDAK